MNVVEEHQPNCLVTLHVEVPVDRVNRQWDTVVDEFKKFASIQGYRKGAAPRKLVESRFAKEIRKELQSKLLDSSLEEAIKSKGLEVISILGFENIELEKNAVLRYSAKVATAPTFELPAYTGIELEIPAPVVSEEELEQALQHLRAAYVTYEPIENRGLEIGDMAVVTYSTSLDGQPLDIIPDAPVRLRSRKHAWIQLDSNAVLPGFSEALVGMLPDEKKSFELTVDMDYSVESLRGKKIAFETTLEGINQEVLPEWSDELANKILPETNLEELKKLLRARLEEVAQKKFEARKRQGIIDHLLSKVHTEVPSHLVRSETKRVIQEIVKDSQARGGNITEILKQEKDIVGFAEKSAQERVLAAFLLLKIAEKENIQITDEDISTQVVEMAQRHKVAVPKLVKDLNRKNAFGMIREEILLDKALNFVVANATVREPVLSQPEEDASVASNA